MGLKSWGRCSPILDIFSKSTQDWRCPSCGWGANGKYFEHAVGFKIEPKYTELDGSTKVGIVVVECQNCFEPFWFHVTESWAETFKEESPEWPSD